MRVGSALASPTDNNHAEIAKTPTVKKFAKRNIFFVPIPVALRLCESQISAEFFKLGRAGGKTQYCRYILYCDIRILFFYFSGGITIGKQNQNHGYGDASAFNNRFPIMIFGFISTRSVSPYKISYFIIGRASIVCFLCGFFAAVCPVVSFGKHLRRIVICRIDAVCVKIHLHRHFQRLAE